RRTMAPRSTASTIRTAKPTSKWSAKGTPGSSRALALRSCISRIHRKLVKLGERRLIPLQDQLNIGLQRAHVGTPLPLEFVAVDAERLVEKLVHDLGGKERVGRQLAQPPIKQEEFVKVPFHEEVRQSPRLPVAVQLRPERAGIVENLIADDEADIGMLAI